MARETISVTLFNGQIVYSKRLFEPETKDMAGKPLDNPSYSCNIRFPKTKPNWWEEPALAPFFEACRTIHAREMASVPANMLEIPLKDGDRPNKQGKTPDWAKGHWFIRASTSYQPKVEQLVNGAPSEIQSLTMGGRRLWGDGDYVAVALGVAKRMNDNIGIRAYLNSVLFTGKGAELSTGAGNVDWGAALEMAKQQGVPIQQEAPAMQPAAFNPGGFGTAPGPQQGFQPAPTTQQGGFQPAPASAAAPTFQPPGMGGAPQGGFGNMGALGDDKPPF